MIATQNINLKSKYMASVVYYSFTKHVEKLGAFDEYLRKYFPFYDSFSSLGDSIGIASTKQLDFGEEAALNTLIANYVDPEKWLVLNKTENLCLATPFAGGNGSPVVMQAFIMSPSIENIVVDSMKVVVEYTADVGALANFDLESENIELTLEVYDFTRGVSIATATENINSLVAQWKSGASASLWKTVQFYGLWKKITSYDCIWQIRGSINDARVGAKLTCLQKIFYEAL
jgi:hypothetical protein